MSRTWGRVLPDPEHPVVWGYLTQLRSGQIGWPQVLQKLDRDFEQAAAALRRCARVSKELQLEDVYKDAQTALAHVYGIGVRLEELVAQAEAKAAADATKD